MFFFEMRARLSRINVLELTWNFYIGDCTKFITINLNIHFVERIKHGGGTGRALLTKLTCNAHANEESKLILNKFLLFLLWEWNVM